MVEEQVRTPGESPLVVLQDSVVFPHILTSLAFHHPMDLAAIDEAMNREPKTLVCVTARNSGKEEAAPLETVSPELPVKLENLHEVGTMVLIHKLLRIPAGGVAIMVQGIRRVKIDEIVQTDPVVRVRVHPDPESTDRSVETEALMRLILGQVKQLAELAPYLPDEFETMALNIDNPHHLAYLVVTFLKLPVEDRQKILELDSSEAKLTNLSTHLEREIELLELGGKIKSKIQDDVQKSQRDFFLREQVRAIQKELGDGEEGDEDIVRYREKIAKSLLPPEVLREVNRELDRLVRFGNGQSQESGVIRTYLDVVLDLPWARHSSEPFSIEKAQKILDEDHYGIEKVKDRILDELAVHLRAKGKNRGPVLCFIGPPGVGKTTLGQSIARAMGRSFVRVSLGGVRDDSEIRGHRRTYVGAMPGRIIQGMRKAGTHNPVFMLDEIDKLGSDQRGDPASALLEVLDSSQNKDFRDHYLDLPFDLSEVFFIATANVFQTIPPPLLDRMEIIRLAGYTWEEKRHIARQYLIPRVMKELGIDPFEFRLDDPALVRLIREFTREAGVRTLDRKIATLLRKVVRVRSEMSRKRKVIITPKSLSTYLGNEYVEPEHLLDKSAPGVVTGLAWTPNGGDVLFIETLAIEGSKGFILTGHLGDVMKESARTAFSVVQSRIAKLGIEQNFFSKNEIHVHVPGGAIPKDGPSAGITIAVAIVSLVTGIPVPETLAMTGEIALSGRVLPVGGVKEKLIGAREAGIKRVFIPEKNAKDLLEIPEEVKKDLTIVLVSHIDDIFDECFSIKKRKKPVLSKVGKKSS